MQRSDMKSLKKSLLEDYEEEVILTPAQPSARFVANPLMTDSAALIPPVLVTPKPQQARNILGLEALQSVTPQPKPVDFGLFSQPRFSSNRATATAVDFFAMSEPSGNIAPSAKTTPDIFGLSDSDDYVVPTTKSSSQKPAVATDDSLDIFGLSESDHYAVPTSSSKKATVATVNLTGIFDFSDLSEYKSHTDISDATAASVDFLGLNQNSSLDRSDVADDGGLLSFLSQPAAASPRDEQATELSSVNLNSPRPIAVFPNVVEQDEITDEEALSHAETMAKQLVDFYVEELSSSTQCTNVFFKCIPPIAEKRAIEFLVSLNFERGDYDKTSKAIIEMVKTGKVEGVKGSSSFAPEALRGMFINRFIPHYSKDYSMSQQWLRAARIRQETFIDKFDRAALISIAKKDLYRIENIRQQKERYLKEELHRVEAARPNRPMR
jgi:hypothetical protein